MIIVNLLAGALALLSVGAGAWLAMAGTVVLAVGLEDQQFDPRHLELAAFGVILAGLALFIAGSFGCLELLA